ncbi:MAG: hypothetical protein LBQ89_08105 [Treponema sp.]|nr:hypothetical protein [Treponema sp.]
MATCNCTKCGAEIRYIPTNSGHIKVEADYVEIVTDRGRVVQGHFRHDCPAEKKDNAPSTGVLLSGGKL